MPKCPEVSGLAVVGIGQTTEIKPIEECMQKLPQLANVYFVENPSVKCILRIIHQHLECTSGRETIFATFVRGGILPNSTNFTDLPELLPQ